MTPGDESPPVSGNPCNLLLVAQPHHVQLADFQRLALRIRAMQSLGIPVPRWALVTPDDQPDLRDFGPYVVMKPDWSGKGADVKIVRRGRVRWRPPATDYTKRLQGDRGNWLAQEFIYTLANRARRFAQ
jgi:glutathione synthase/RimK-type ligase-like ATP-grasp enzyme